MTVQIQSTSKRHDLVKTPALPTQPEMPEPVALFCPEFGPSFPILAQDVRFDPNDPKLFLFLLQLQEFSQRNQTWGLRTSTFVARLSLDC